MSISRIHEGSIKEIEKFFCGNNLLWLRNAISDASISNYSDVNESFVFLPGHRDFILGISECVKTYVRERRSNRDGCVVDSHEDDQRSTVLKELIASSNANSNEKSNNNNRYTKVISFYLHTFSCSVADYAMKP